LPHLREADSPKAILEAVGKERERIQEKPSQEPKTAHGKRIKTKTGAATVLIDQLMENIGVDLLTKFKTDGKPH
jgi:hypothetical protein